PRWIWFITGPTACGKTTVAKGLAQALGFKFVEGDDYHPPHNREKLSRNEPLTDQDRAAWLDALSKLESSQPDTDDATHDGSSNLVITCSALKKPYRDILRRGGGAHHSQEAGGNLQAGRRDMRVRFVLLDVDEDVLRQRARERHGHFVGEGLVASQVRTLERPAGDGDHDHDSEEGDVLVVEVGKGIGVEDTVAEVERRVKGEMGL
ncbi:carbohydrate kinase, partial [Parathielavia hyrcaniae]